MRGEQLTVFRESRDMLELAYLLDSTTPYILWSQLVRGVSLQNPAGQPAAPPWYGMEDFPRSLREFQDPTSGGRWSQVDRPDVGNLQLFLIIPSFFILDSKVVG